jgi:hypothetical protein
LKNRYHGVFFVTPPPSLSEGGGGDGGVVRRTPVGMSSVKDVSLRRIALTPVVDVFGFDVGVIVGFVVGGGWWLQVDPFLRRVDTAVDSKNT